MTIAVTAVIRTLCYADIFSCALSLQEIWQKAQSGSPLSLERVRKALDKLVVEGKVCTDGRHYALKGKQIFLKLRRSRLRYNHQKVSRAKKLLKWLAYLPWIESIYLTGSVAAENADKNDDIDVMVVTRDNRLWLVRFLITIIYDLFRLRRKPHETHLKDVLCFNLFIEVSSMKLDSSRRNLYTAHEILQAMVIFEKRQSNTFSQLNAFWVKKFLPNFITGFPTPSISSIHQERSLLSWMNNWLFRLQYRHMIPKIRHEEVRLHAAFFHPQSRVPKLSRLFESRKKANGLV